MSRLDHYRLLGVTRGASAEEIASAYRTRAQVCHPDRLAGAPEPVVRAASDLMALLNEARAVLADPVQREAYDVPPPTQRVPDQAAPPRPAPRYVPLRVVPDRIVSRSVVPGTPVVVVVRFESPVPQDARPRVRAADPAIVIESDLLHGSSRRAQVKLRIQTNLLAEHKRYTMDLAAEWGTAIGLVSLDVETAELQAWDGDEPARKRHPSARSRRVPGSQRRRDLVGWLIGGLLLPVLTVGWARGHLPVGAPPWSAWAQLAAALALLAGLYPLVVTRGFGRVTVHVAG
ncbi:MAG TPA: J domain-containing protein, partial [Actinomycetota bacterium]|nr:J domain-containing protein [Actinomycetota bacterium]